MMKVAFSGAHGTGKTTLLTRVAHLLGDSRGVRICKEVPRDIIATIGDTNFFRAGQNTPLRQMLILLQQVVDEQISATDWRVMLLDRTLVDHLAYTLDLFPDLGDGPEFRILRRIVMKWVRDIDIVFKLPIEFDIVGDGVRGQDKEFQVRIDRRIDELYLQSGVQPILIAGDIETRSSTVVQIVERQLNS